MKNLKELYIDQVVRYAKPQYSHVSGKSFTGNHIHVSGKYLHDT